MRALAIFVVISAVTVGACGGKSPKADPAADLAVAKSAVLTAADLPGYKATPHSAGDDIPAGVKKDFATCMGTSTTIFDDTPGAQKADSADFADGVGDSRSVSDTVEIDPHKSDIDKGWDEISKSGAEPCIGKLFEAATKQGALSQPGVKVGQFVVNRFDIGVGDRSVGYGVSVSVSGATRSVMLYIDLVFVPRDRAGMDFSFTNLGTPIDRSLEKTLVQKVYDRVGDKAK